MSGNEATNLPRKCVKVARDVAIRDCGMANQRQLFINGGFASHPITGVQRYSLEITKRMLGLPAQQAYRRITIIAPRRPDGGVVRRNLWEQVILLSRTTGGVLFSPSSIGPWFHPRHVVTIHDMRAFNEDHLDSLPYRTMQWHRASLRVLTKTARRLITDSLFSQCAIRERFDVSDERVKVVYPGADHVLDFGYDETTLDRLQLRPGSYVLAVGSLYPHKNVRVLHAIDWDAYGLTVCIVGEAPKTNARAFQEIVEDARRQPNSIRYTGRLSDPEVRALYAGAFAYVFPSLYEGFGIPPLEAMHCGCPVIASDRAAIPEVCGDAAVYFDAVSPRSLQNAVEALINGKVFRSGMVERGYERARQFTWDRATEQIMKVLEDL